MRTSKEILLKVIIQRLSHAPCIMAFLRLINLFIMIYKWNKSSTESTLEIEKNGETKVEVSIQFDYDEDLWRTIILDKDDVFKLIGALHQIQKDLE